MKIFFSLFLLSCALCTYAQSDSTVTDTIALRQLEEITVTAYGQNRSIADAPAAINTINARMLERFGNTSPLPALNTTPGVRMEERSPGSYRLNIRGSSLRSPFGVRNVKIYYNNIPITDPGGFTYLNQLGYYNMKQIDVIKGPASSLYGSGNGGAMLISSIPFNWEAGATLGYNYGSYNQHNAVAEVRLGNDHFKNTIRYQHLSSNGYRTQSAMHKDIISWDGLLQTGSKGALSITTLYTDLYYQTPGALTLAEYEANPRSARPRVGATPGAVENKAAIHQKNILGGLTYQYNFNDHWQHATTVYGSYTAFTNPTVRNYSDNIEPHYGGHTVVKYNATIGQSYLQWQLGAEAQQENADIKTLTNNLGKAGTLQTDDDVNSRQLMGFTQLTWKLQDWIFEGGLSVNNYKVDITRVSNTPATKYTTDLGVQLSPRLAVLYKASSNTSIYVNAAKGFSTPTTAELSPSGSAINLALRPEIGWNYEAGIRGHAFNKRLTYDASAFYYNLSNAIVQRRDASGGDTYINAGATDQTGFEGMVDYAVIGSNTNHIIRSLNIWGSYTYYSFKYRNFIQEANDYSGNGLPGVSPNTIAAGIDAHFKYGFYTNITYNFIDKIALNDANTDYANAYHLLAAKIGYVWSLGRYNLQLYTGVDNALNQRYSLGNDINAAGGRYYNAAPGTNYYVGMQIDYLHKRK